MPQIQSAIAGRIVDSLGCNEPRAPLRQLGGIDLELEQPLPDVEPDRIAVLHQPQRPAGGGFGRDMQHDRPERGTAHPCIRDAHHVLDALARKLERNRNVARFRHPRRATRSGIAQDEHVVARDIEIGRVDPRREIIERIEDDGTAAMRQQCRRRRSMFDDGAVRGEVAPEHGDRASGVDRVVDAPDDLLPGDGFRGGNELAQRPARYRRNIQMEQRTQLAQDGVQAAGLVQMLHVMRA